MTAPTSCGWSGPVRSFLAAPAGEVLVFVPPARRCGPAVEALRAAGLVAPR